jgi:hypothetical protein
MAISTIAILGRNLPDPPLFFKHFDHAIKCASVNIPFPAQAIKVDQAIRVTKFL